MGTPSKSNSRDLCLKVAEPACLVCENPEVQIRKGTESGRSTLKKILSGAHFKHTHPQDNRRIFSLSFPKNHALTTLPPFFNSSPSPLLACRMAEGPSMVGWGSPPNSGSTLAVEKIVSFTGDIKILIDVLD